ncbi:unnamed protein product [Rotaria sordida]|uniref:Uncharacterized protein n=1 Tax=Rotaria sordida TaxID=392033 RepID=A0A814Y908_9BILA|nr:unnamed protein product [Rotaria sordida]CAF1225860.1 unnamed protein product [Rotaria sordida]CAF1238657.1 unnamed protein product [Rotaria sordida]
MITLATLITMLIIPIKSMSMRDKRWTFNSWRLHGRRYTSHAPVLTPTIEPYPPTIATDVNPQDQLLNGDNDEDDNIYNSLICRLQLFQKLDRKQKVEDNDNIEF